MKTLVEQSIVSKSQRFIKNISNQLPEGVKSFSISTFGMERASGYGSYNYIMDVEINDVNVRLKKSTHDSVDFDYYQDLEYMSHNYNNWTKDRVLIMLSTDYIRDMIFEIANSEEEL